MEQGYSRAVLAERARLSIKTIQRLESGQTVPRGHTLQQLAEALNLDIQDLTRFAAAAPAVTEETPPPPPFDPSAHTRLKYLNVSALLILLFPLGNLLPPLYHWWKYRHLPLIQSVGGAIVSFQILWTIFSALALIFAPFVLQLFPDSPITTTGSVIFTYLGCWISNMLATIAIATQIRAERWERLQKWLPHLL